MVINFDYHLYYKYLQGIVVVGMSLDGMLPGVATTQVAAASRTLP